MGKLKVIVFLSLVIFGTYGIVRFFRERIPKDVCMEAKKLPGEHADAKAKVVNSQSSFRRFQNSPEFDRYKAIADVDGWNSFEKDLKSLAEQENRIKEVQSLVWKNKTFSRNAKVLIDSIRSETSAIVAHALRWEERKKILDSAPLYEVKLRSEVTTKVQDLQLRFNTSENLLNEYCARFPNAAADFKKHFQPFGERVAGILKLYEDFKAALAKKNTLLSADAYHILMEDLAAANSKYPDYPKDLGVLGWANSQIVNDLNCYPMLILERETWSNSSDGTRKKDITMPISLTDFVRMQAFFAKHNDVHAFQLGYLKNGDFLSWNSGNIWILDLVKNTLKENLYVDRGYNDEEGVLFVKEYKLTSFAVQFANIDSTGIKPGEWQTGISEEEFWVYARFFGMEGARKMVGQMEMDQCRFTPAGFSLISTNQGEWLDNGTGGRYWVFGGNLAALNAFYADTDRISEADYKAWLAVKDSQDYFGKHKQYALFGYALHASPYFKNTTFAKMGGLSPEFVAMVRTMWPE
ncbi:MAG TPA: hypothetical protein VEA59_02150 [Patescibacteria group bacterium]|nr:hypothetical protein [Patescibacteria group bacterium]